MEITNREPQVVGANEAEERLAQPARPFGHPDLDVIPLLVQGDGVHREWALGVDGVRDLDFRAPSGIGGGRFRVCDFQGCCRDRAETMVVAVAVERSDVVFGDQGSDRVRRADLISTSRQ